MRHGTLTGYSYYRCRCYVCRRARSEHMRRGRERGGRGRVRRIRSEGELWDALRKPEVFWW